MTLMLIDEYQLFINLYNSFISHYVINKQVTCGNVPAEVVFSHCRVLGLDKRYFTQVSCLVGSKSIISCMGKVSRFWKLGNSLNKGLVKLRSQAIVFAL